MSAPPFARPFNPSTSFPRSNNVSKPVVPEKQTSIELSNRLFLNVSEGNFSKIKDFLISNQMSMTSKDQTNGESVLHMIIKNSNISEYEKITLVKFAIDKGASVSSPDANNVTPLHLACKYQYADIVTLLTAAGANVNSTDSQYKTPLHYAVVGENVECPTNTNEKPLIPKTKNINNVNESNKHDVEISNLHKSVHEFVFTDVNTKKYIENITNTMQNIQNMYPFDINSIVESNKKYIIDVLLTPNLNDTDREKTIFEKINDTKRSIYNSYIQKINTAIQEIQINPNTTDGWGPDNIDSNKILPSKSLHEILNISSVATLTEKTNLIAKIQKYVGDLTRVSDSMIAEFEKLNGILGVSQTYCHVIGNNTTNTARAQLQDCSLLIPYLFNNRSRTIQPMDFIHNVVIDIVNETQTDINGTRTPFPVASDDPKNTVQIRVSKADDKEWKKTHPAGSDARLMTDEFPYKIGSVLPPDGNLGAPIDLDKIGNGTARTEGKYFDTVVRIASRFLGQTMTELRDASIDLTDELEKNAVYNVLQYLPQVVLGCFNVATLLKQIQGELPMITRQLNGLRDFFTRTTPILDENLQFLSEQIIDALDPLTNIQESTSINIDNMYNISTNIVDTVNSIISYVEMYSADVCLISYFRTPTFDGFYTSDNVNGINAIINKPIERFRPMPKSMNDFIKLFEGNDMYTAKKNIIETYFPQITSVNSPSYITRMAPVRLPRIGIYLTNIVQMLTNVDTRRLTVPIHIRETNAPTNVDPVNNTYKAEIGIVHTRPYTKNEALPPVIGKFLGSHLIMLKYSIIRWIISQIYYIKTNARVPVTDTETNIKSAIDKILDSVKNTITFEPNNHSFILTLVGRYVDKILNNFITGLVTNQTNIILLKSLEQPNMSPHNTELLRNILGQPTPLIPSLDKTQEFDSNEVFDDIVSIYTNNTFGANLESVAILNGSTGTTEVGNINKNIIVLGNPGDQTCYKINPSVIKNLIRNNSNQKVDVNAKDNLGNSAIYYAIEMQNIEIIKMLVTEYGAKASSTRNIRSQNRMGQTSVEYAWDIFCRSTVQLNTIDTSTVSTQRAISELSKNSKYSNNIPKYSDIIIPMAMYLLNHQFYVVGKNYPNNWTYDLNKRFETILGFTDTDTSKLPMLEIDITDNEIAVLNVSTDQITKLTDKITQNTKKIETLRLQTDNFTRELATQPTNNDLTQQIRSNQAEIAALIAKNTEYQTQLTALNNKKTQTFRILKDFVSRHKDKLQKSGSVVDIYESVFTNVLNNDYHRNLKSGQYDYKVDTRTYASMWNKHITDVYANKNIHIYTLIIDVVNDYQKQLMDTQISPLEKLDNLGTIFEYYSNIVSPFSKNYAELPTEYNASNYALSIVIDIITHVVKRIMFSVMFGIIVKLISQHVLVLYPRSDTAFTDDKQYGKYIADMVIGIVNDSGTGSSKLMKYIFHILPLKCVKVILKIYEGENEGEGDIDRSTTIESLFMHINKIIASTTVIDIGDKSVLLTNLQDFVYPFYIDYTTIFVKEMKLCVDNYLKNLQRQSQGLEILRILS